MPMLPATNLWLTRAFTCHHQARTSIGLSPSSALPWRGCIPWSACDTASAHQQAGQRTLKITAVAARLAFPHAARPSRPSPQISDRKKQLPRPATPITSLTATQVATLGSPPSSAPGHRAIKDHPHYIRDIDYLTGPLPRSAPASGPASFTRNLAITILQIGHTSIAAAIRTTPAVRTGRRERSGTS